MNTQALIDVTAERTRQVSGEGFTPERDDQYKDCELMWAAVGYATTEDYNLCTPGWWPWDCFWWKPGTYRQNLVKAAALLLAEIERIDRAEAKDSES